ncbi:hypothetical protein PGTUg99_036981 [Puccinia graminis f. sp. tritici]|uniref:Uncharacterized protein n=1 Tax=Puccinia graminis f. sp. tritici TaxID=56615 RepID=A0A5B0S3J5_PUCGR|nr:hypothetical protein PGTUg99_036981 [Puccinia graminis f. sp. tritici]
MVFFKFLMPSPCAVARLFARSASNPNSLNPIARPANTVCLYNRSKRRGHELSPQLLASDSVRLVIRPAILATA